MNDIILTLKELPYFTSLGATSAADISEAEIQLNVIFSNEYFAYVMHCGVASGDGHEFTGICKSPRLNVVDVTIAERANNPTVPQDWYVIEKTNIDGIVIWQNANGEIYQTQPGCLTIRIASSLAEYITR